MSDQMKNEDVLDLPQQSEEEKTEYIPSPRWKRILAWVLFAVVAVGIGLWLLDIARPEWPDTVWSWFTN